MPVKVDETVQEVNVVRASIETHKADLATKGYSVERVAKFDASKADLLGKDSAQKLAQVTLEQRTKEQDAIMVAAGNIITKLQNAASSAYGKDKTALKEFRVGVEKPRTVSKMETTLEYLTGVAAKHATDLIANGFTQDDISSLSTIYGNLVAADAVQENSKKLRNAATEARDNSAAAMKLEIFKLRKFVKAAFSDNKALLEEFKPIKRGGKRGGAKPPGPSPEPPQAPQK